GTMDRAVRKFLDRTSYFGQNAEMDSQGRILIHQNLRLSAGLTGELAVLGYLQYIEVWAWDAFKARIDAQPFTDEDAAELARFQI
ncbi:MAG TPA: division/cell wall cluster transcriptional repressor MraZ, partial [Blastocatellia bacterium]